MNIDIRQVNVVGAGVMGTSIAQLLAQSGFSPVVRDVDEETLRRGLRRVRESLDDRVRKGKIASVDRDGVLSRLTFTTELREVAAADLIIEAVTENMAIKKQLFRELDELCPPRTILATNTSILSPTEIGSFTARRDKVIGTHFSNPATVLKLLEITPAYETSPETIAAVRELMAKRLGKTVVMARESPGGVVSRISIAMRNEAVRVLTEGVASVEDIDTAMKAAFGYPMGPLELIDLVGIDLHVTNSETLYRELSDPKFAPPALLRTMVRAGHLGRKTGRGFYDYSRKNG